MDRYTLYYLLTFIAFIATFGAQMYIRHIYSKYSKIDCVNMMNGANVASKILMSNNLRVNVNRANGYLSDHYDPINKMVTLSEYNYSNSSISAVSVSAHECGHALQDDSGYTFLKIRSMMFPIVRFSSYTGYIAISVGLMFSILNLVLIGILLEMIILLFQIVTLPVEFDASSRALKQLEINNILNEEELKDAKKVLRAAALTYVAGVASTLIEILRLLLIISTRSSRRRD